MNEIRGGIAGYTTEPQKQLPCCHFNNGYPKASLGIYVRKRPVRTKQTFNHLINLIILLQHAERPQHFTRGVCSENKCNVSSPNHTNTSSYVIIALPWQPTPEEMSSPFLSFICFFGTSHGKGEERIWRGTLIFPDAKQKRWHTELQLIWDSETMCMYLSFRTSMFEVQVSILLKLIACFIWVRKLDSHPKGRTQIEDYNYGLLDRETVQVGRYVHIYS
jgi:hypothetical protein